MTEQTYVEYVVRQPFAGRWLVYMIELKADGKTFLNSTEVSHHRTLAGAERAAAKLRARDEAHISSRLEGVS